MVGKIMGFHGDFGWLKVFMIYGMIMGIHGILL